MLRPETKARARALQLLYAWEVRGKPPIERVIHDIRSWDPGLAREHEDAEQKALAVSLVAERLDAEIGRAADNWRLERIGVNERNILRLALHELEAAEVPPRVAISEAVRLAQWFAAAQAPAFVNGVLDRLARERRYL